MKVKETFVSYTGEIDVGRFGFFLNLAGEGVSLGVDEIARQAIHFPRVILIGDPLVERDELSKLVKKINKGNPDAIIEINCNGIVKPLKAGEFKNIKYNVHIQLSRTGIDKDKRMNSQAISWYNEVGADFKFEIVDRNDVDEVNLITQEFGIKKRQVFLSPENPIIFNEVLGYAKKCGFNFSPNARKFLWNDDGRIENGE